MHKAFAIGAAGFLAALALTTGTPHAQHSYTPQQIQEGRALYDANCGRCHNDDGAGVTGIELFKQIRRANSDEEVAKLIQGGIPGTSMPPHAFTTDQALSVVAYMRSMIGVTPAVAGAAAAARASEPVMAGDPGRGKAIFAGKGGCAGCHRAEGAGGTSAPDLSNAGATRGQGPFSRPPDPVALRRSIVDPNAEIAPGHQMFQVTPKTGAVIRGTLLNHDTFSIQLRDEAQNLRSFMKADMKDFGFLPSAMPSYRDRLSEQEVADVVSYLLTLKGQNR